MSEFNPFAALLEQDRSTENSKHPVRPDKSINSTLEEIFGFTLDDDIKKRKHLIFLEEIARTFSQTELSLPLLQHALFDRLFMCNEDNLGVKVSNTSLLNIHAFETKVMAYLYNCYRRLNDCSTIRDEEKLRIKSIIIENSVTAFIQSEIYERQDLELQLIDILKEGLSYNGEFFKDLYKGVLKEEEGGELVLQQKISHLLLRVVSDITNMNIINFDYGIFNIFNVFSTEEYLANILIETKPAKFSTGFDYVNTPLGALFNNSVLPKVPNGLYEHFQDPTVVSSIVYAEGVLWSSSKKLTEHLHTLMLNLLTCSSLIKHKTLNWLGQCIHSNLDRGKLWNAHSLPELNPANYTNIGDGFMINLGNVMLRLCQPFCSNYKDLKILKIDPTYCAVPDEQLQEKEIHLPGMCKETFIISGDEEQPFLVADNFNFITECFYLAHKVIDLGYRVAVDKIIRLNHEVSRMERAYVDAVAQTTGNNEIVDALKRRMSQHLTKYLSLKTQLSDPVLLNLYFDFTAASGFWLSQVAVRTKWEELSKTSYAPLSTVEITFPLPSEVPLTLKSIPEFIVENIVCYLVFLRRYSPKIFEARGFEKLEPLLTFILIYMGSSERMKNPHLRARLAEALEALLPHHDDQPPGFNEIGGFQRELLFTQHPHRHEIVTSLLHVFVGIEMTGQSVEFEQKFNYRRPMYVIMSYLWTKEEYKVDFKKLAEDAEKTMDAVTPPLFLRFINLLMNDAVHLLDEALSNMAKIKEMELARQNGEWDSLPQHEREQNSSYLLQIGMMAKFDNILGRDTIKTLEKLTSEITIVFTHSTMVDRVAAMLNYFLYNLVGPKKKNFKVKDQKEYSFDPATTVLNICKIYVNLKESDSFCLAISQDGRSYSPKLFALAEDVLVRIGGGALISELNELATRVAKIAQQQQANEEAIAEAPDHFLDPIMSTIMSDPVILPSSRQTVDRTTIARHLLSDQTDPFNRAPLSMDQVIPNTALAEEIKRWVNERDIK